VCAVIVLLLATGLVWASVGALDVVTVARGRIVLAGRSKVVQAPESGIVRAIRVKDGQRVRRGEALVELDPTVSAAEARRLATEHAAARIHVARLRALLEGADDLVAPPGAGPHLVALQRRLLRDQRAEHAHRVHAARLKTEQQFAALEATRAGVARLEALVRVETERALAYQALLAREYVARIQYLEVEGRRLERLEELRGEQRRLEREEAALAEARAQQDVIEAEFRRARLAELTEWESRAASLGEEAVKAAERRRVQRVVAPEAGVVQQLAVHTVGGVVVPAQALLVIVPERGPLEVEAWLENKDIGFVRPGQPVEIKIETFPFTRYGTVPGVLAAISGDAVPQDRAGLVYVARVSLARSTIRVEGRDVPLSPGMVVTVEIRTGDRRVIDFLLSPVLRHLREGLRER
jgi:hemolysin D